MSIGGRSAERFAAPLARSSPQTSAAFSGWNRIGSQPSASSAVSSTFLGPSDATWIGMPDRRGCVMIFSGLPRPVPWSAGSGSWYFLPSCTTCSSRAQTLRQISMISRVRWSGVVGHAVESLDDLRARGTQTEDAATLGQVVDARRGHRHQRGRAGVDRQDARRDLHGVGHRREVAHEADGVVAVGLGDVDDVQAGLLERLHLCDRFGEAAGVADLHADLHDEVPPTFSVLPSHSLRSASCARSREPMSAPFSK